MATAVEPSSKHTPGATMSLPVASFIGTLYVLAALAVVFYAVPSSWTQVFGDRLILWFDFDPSMRVVQLAAAVGLIWFGYKLAGDTAPVGLRGGIFLMISAAITIFFLVRAVAMNVSGPIGMIVTGTILVVLLFFASRFFFGSRGTRWMISLEEQGWFSIHQYKRSLGVKVRRLTTLGIGIIGGTAIYSMSFQGVLPEHWVLAMPFGMESFTVLPNARINIPILIGLATGWVAWRAVHVPEFAEFLIATEAEMNKVSWSTRRRLAQDTVVVLITTLLLTLFLLVVDLFWGWLLSIKQVGVLPPAPTNKGQDDQNKEAKW
ncbi:MAG: preprotein translocase subunit SecE [Planctomycetia bacterium]|nr:preprotein translocase subunit SecE [Planctomycetia bacterium]